MSVAESGAAWFKAVLIAPFVAILFGAVGKVMVLMYQATQIEGNRELAQAQDSIFHNGMLALDLLELASSIETWILFGGFILAIYFTTQSIISGNSRR
ncbi:hypothetical protein [Halopiger xanaduensis]|uniref:hypothetical protein n=1 Tax=Halopiger xanaduensis TaxID=387343 RepID=UPI0011D2A645|nr:hypothetical protein [Halopiger xanaduensis]